MRAIIIEVDKNADYTMLHCTDLKYTFRVENHTDINICLHSIYCVVTPSDVAGSSMLNYHVGMYYADKSTSSLGHGWIVLYD